jgi:predicted O-methyltransferase YrrM
MDRDLDAQLAELERFGAGNDAAATARSDKMLNITHDTGELLAALVVAARARRVLEIGTSNGYSTLWLAHAARLVGGAVVTVERSPTKAELARANVERSGLGSFISLVEGDAAAVLRGWTEAAFDVIFLDADRREYAAWWPDVRRVLAPGGLIVVDNALSHADEVAPFLALVRSDGAFITCLVPVGKGEFLAAHVRQGGSAGVSAGGQVLN